MKLFLLTLVALVVVVSAKRRKHHPMTTEAPTTTPLPPLEQRLKQMEERLQEQADIMSGLSRQVMLQHFFAQEKIRSDGNSGLKHTRVTRDGTRNYHENSHMGSRFMAIHDHTNYDRTAGLGELMPVMNGVEFRTRHNDYLLKMPSTTSEEYHHNELIPFPEVPPSVLNKKTIPEQVQEMREYFLAFKTQNSTHRDYKPYFKPLLCYMEGVWNVDSTVLDEPFESQRHHIDADSWYDLMEKIRYTSYTGSKSVLENYAYLPITIMNVENGKPIFARWSYRILCHPLKKEIPLSYFKQEDDLLYRFPNKQSMEQTLRSRSQRFKLNTKPFEHYENGDSIMDQLMSEIPGKNNYMANLTDNSFGMSLEDVRFRNHTPINSGYYNRYFRTLDKGAMGTKSIRRGFGDANLFAAMNTQPNVAPMSIKTCQGHGHSKVCSVDTVRYSYALPVEIIYTTPLYNWNPYDLPSYSTGIVKKDGRSGGKTLETAYNGTNPKGLYYRTPSEFFSKETDTKDAADTAKKGAGVLDKNGQIRFVSSSGVRIQTRNIAGVGIVRLRYPIMPIYGEGSGVWKELNALKDMTMQMNRYASLFEEAPSQLFAANDTDTEGDVLHYKLEETHQDPPGEHSHDVFITRAELKDIQDQKYVYVTSSEDMGHSHSLVLQNVRHNLPNSLMYTSCDGLKECWDGHDPRLNRVKP